MNKKTKTIETERLMLRAFTLDDAEQMFKNYCSSEKVTEFMEWSPHASVEVTKNFIRDFVFEEYKNGNEYRWAIVLKEIGEVVGAIDVVLKVDKKKLAELGWVLGDKFWGRGIMPEAATAVVNYLFDEGFVRIQALHKCENKKSGRVMQKLGMLHEGILKRYSLDNKGNYHDCEMYAIINPKF